MDTGWPTSFTDSLITLGFVAQHKGWIDLSNKRQTSGGGGAMGIGAATHVSSLEERVAFDEVADRLGAMVADVGSPEAAVSTSRQGSFGTLDAEVATPLAMVLTELLQNAVEHGFAHGSGAIRLGVVRAGGRLRVTVADDGAGLPPARDRRSGTENLAMTLAFEWGHAGVRVNTVSPGWIASSGMDTYEGEFKRSFFNGQGEIVSPDGRKYAGEFVLGNFQGNGRYQTREGARYEGEFLNWRMHGKGRFTDPGGNVYEGTFVNGELDGKGTLSGPQGNRYAGDFKQWRFEGQGELRLANGDVYRGGFAEARFNGANAVEADLYRDGYRAVAEALLKITPEELDARPGPDQKAVRRIRARLFGSADSLSSIS